MNKIIKLLKSIDKSKKNIVFTILAIFFASCLFVIPFVHAFTVKSFALVLLCIFVLALVISGLVIASILVFFKAQTCLYGTKFKELFVAFGMAFAVELAIFGIVSFFTLFYPLAYLLVGLIFVLCVATFNIFLMYNYLRFQTTSTVSLARAVKIFNISLPTLAMLIWFLV